jgi:uncharacterized protein
MIGPRVFLDAVFIHALLNRADQYHKQAVELSRQLSDATEIGTTEAVLTEIANSLSSINRSGASRFIEEAYRAANIKIVSVDRALFHRALELYRQRPDKLWSLTDCISFVVMREQSLRDALTADHHFEQAGFVALIAPEAGV